MEKLIDVSPHPQIPIHSFKIKERNRFIINEQLNTNTQYSSFFSLTLLRSQNDDTAT